MAIVAIHPANLNEIIYRPSEPMIDRIDEAQRILDKKISVCIRLEKRARRVLRRRKSIYRNQKWK